MERLVESLTVSAERMFLRAGCEAASESEDAEEGVRARHPGLGMIVTGMALVLPNYGVPQARLEVYEAINQANGRFSKVALTPLPFLSVDEDVMLGMNMRW